MDLADLGPVPGPEVSVRDSPDDVMQDLAGQMGAEVAAPLTAALERVNLLATTGRIGARSLRALREEIEAARRAAMMGQQISRVARGRVQCDPERVDLPQVLREMLSQRGREIDARGFEVRQVLRPAVVSADAALLSSLLQGLIDWAFEHSCERTIHLVTDLRNWPVCGQLMCEFAWRPADQIDTEANSELDTEPKADLPTLDTMAWQLVVHMAAAMGVSVERSDSAWQARVLLEFPQASDTEPSHLSDLIDIDDPHGLALNSRPLAGSHVLVVSPRREVRNLVREAVRSMGLMVDYVTSLVEAREFCRTGMPHGVVYDGSLASFEALRRELLAEVAGVVFVQISEDVRALEVAATGTPDEITTVGLHDIVAALPQALLYALSRGR